LTLPISYNFNHKQDSRSVIYLPCLEKLSLSLAAPDPIIAYFFQNMVMKAKNLKELFINVSSMIMDYRKPFNLPRSVRRIKLSSDFAVNWGK